MEHIEVTPEMRQRILKNIEQADLSTAAPQKAIRFPHIRQLAALAACLAIILVGALALPNLFHGTDDPNSPDNPNGPDVLAPGDGIVQVGSVEELSEKAGFKVDEWSSLPFQAEEAIYTAYWQDMAEIAYSGEGQTAVYRKGIGLEDVSGDYTTYESEIEIAARNTTVALKGNGNAYTLAAWTDGTYSYSLALSNGITEAEWQEILAGEF